MADLPESHLSPETVAHLVDRTVAVCTVATDQRQPWIQRLVEDRLTHSRQADIFTFYNALIAICRGKTLTLTEHNPYHEAVEDAQARIQDYQQPEPPLARQKLRTLVGTTVRVCTQCPDQQAEWTENLRQERDQHSDGTDLQALYDALLALCNGDKVLITPENRYYRQVQDAIATIETYNIDQVATPTPPVTEDTTPETPAEPQDAGLSHEEAFLLCQQTLIVRVVGTKLEFDGWIGHLETRQDQSTKHKTVIELISALIDIMQTGQADDLPDDHPYADLVQRYNVDIQWVESIMAHSMAVLTRDRNNYRARAAWLHELRRLQDMEEGQGRMDRVAFLGAIDLLISENEVTRLQNGHRLELVWERMLRRAEAHRNRKHADTTTIVEKTKQALATVNRGKRVRWTKNIEQLLAATTRTRYEAMSEHQRDMRGFLEAVLAILNGEPVGNLWGNAYQDDVESLRAWQRDLELQQAVQQFVQSGNPQGYIAQNEALVVSDAFLLALQSFMTKRAQEANSYQGEQALLAGALAHRAADLGRKLIAYREAKQESLEKSFQPQPLDVLRTLYDEDGEVVLRQRLLDDDYPDMLKDGLMSLYKETGDLMFPALLEREGFPPEFCAFMLDYVRSVA